MNNHYTWLNAGNLKKFFDSVGINIDYHSGVVGAHGDKCYSFQYKWEEAGVPFEHGVAIYLLTYFRPYNFRDDYDANDPDSVWVDTGDWVIENYNKFKQHLPPPIDN